MFGLNRLVCFVQSLSYGASPKVVASEHDLVLRTRVRVRLTMATSYLNRRYQNTPPYERVVTAVNFGSCPRFNIHNNDESDHSRRGVLRKLLFADRGNIDSEAQCRIKKISHRVFSTRPRCDSCFRPFKPRNFHHEERLAQNGYDFQVWKSNMAASPHLGC